MMDITKITMGDIIAICSFFVCIRILWTLITNLCSKHVFIKDETIAYDIDIFYITKSSFKVIIDEMKAHPTRFVVSDDGYCCIKNGILAWVKINMIRNPIYEPKPYDSYVAGFGLLATNIVIRLEKEERKKRKNGVNYV